METSRDALHIPGKSLILLLLSVIACLPLVTHASNKTLVLFPLAIYADKPSDYLQQGVRSMLGSRLSAAGLEVISGEGLESLLGEKEGIATKERAEELARGLNADYAIFGSITTIGGGYSLDLSLLELGKDRPRLTRVSEAVDEDQFIPRLSDLAYRLSSIIEGKEETGEKVKEKAPIEPEPEITEEAISSLESDKQKPEVVEKALLFKPAREYQDFKPTGRISVDMAVMAFDMGDLDGDKEAELVILGWKRLLIYKRQGESFVRRDSLKAGFGEDFLKVSVGDADDNGTEEIYVVSRYGTRARSTVWGWAGGFKRLDRRTGHLQVVKHSAGGKPLLLFQDSKVGHFFSGRMYVMDCDKKGKLTRGHELPELKEAQFYTIAPFDLDGDGDPEFLGLGKFSRLHVWDKQGEILWSSDKKMGGTNNAIRLGEAPPLELPPRIAFNSRLAIMDIDGDGNREVVAIRNIPLIDHLANFKVYNKSSLVAYRVEGTSLFLVGTTKEIDYCVTDIQADGRSLFLAAQKAKMQNITKGSGLIMWVE